MWLHGGLFTTGYGSSPLFDSLAFAQKGVIVVTLNYRLGSLGFIASSAYNGSFTGNYGFLDQRLAMDWVHTNIAGFGGDIRRVTLAGQEAGAMAVGAHIISTNSRDNGNFQAAIMESNPLGISLQTYKTASGFANLTITSAGCGQKNIDTLACMRKKTFEEILLAERKGLPKYATDLFYFTPLVDQFTHGEIVDQPFHLFSRGNFIPLPLLAGTVEAGGFVLAYTLLGDLLNGLDPSVADKNFQLIVSQLFGSQNTDILFGLYPSESYTTADPYSYNKVQQLGDMLTDYGYFCALRNASLGNQLPTSQYRLSYYNVSKPYIYRYEHYPAFLPQPGYCAPDRVCVGAELPYVFGTLNNSELTVKYTGQPQPDDFILSDNVNNAWVNFITTGNPILGQQLDTGFSFPLFDLTENIQIIGSGGGNISISSTRTRAAFCTAWDSINEYPESVVISQVFSSKSPTRAPSESYDSIDSALAAAIAVPIILVFVGCVIWGVVRMTGRWKCDEVICARLRGNNSGDTINRGPLKHFVIETDDHDEESDGVALTASRA